MTWFKVDDKLHDHRKLRQLARTEEGRASIGVWTLAGSWCADNLTDGFVPASVLVRWGTPGHAGLLVDTGLWVVDHEDGEDGWRFRDWADYQPVKVQVEQSRRKGAERVAAWRARRTQEPQPAEPPPRQSTPQVDDEGLAKVMQATGGTKAHAVKTVDFVLARARGEVRNPLRYVLKSIEAEPAAFRYRRGNPTRDQECRTHAGEWADNCRGCVIDGRVGDA